MVPGVVEAAEVAGAVGVVDTEVAVAAVAAVAAVEVADGRSVEVAAADGIAAVAQRYR